MLCILLVKYSNSEELYKSCIVHNSWLVW